MKEIVIFGAGAYGQLASEVFRNDLDCVVRFFIDNDPNKRGKEILGIPVISVEDYANNRYEYEIIICADYLRRMEMGKQLESSGISNFRYFTEDLIYNKERITSWTCVPDCEDIILYNALKEEDSFFWIDVGCNDPDIASVTKLFYEKGGCGINIDIKSDLIDLCNKYRTRDINLNVGVGKENGKACFFEQGPSGALSTLVESNITNDGIKSKYVDVMRLQDICKKYVKDKKISFLKIDVEGMEKDVLLGADFSRYRPKILVIESTLPCTDVPNYDAWENIVISAGYHFVYSRGNNRYYVADEERSLDSRFEPWPKLASKYYIFHVGALYTC